MVVLGFGCFVLGLACLFVGIKRQKARELVADGEIDAYLAKVGALESEADGVSDGAVEEMSEETATVADAVEEVKEVKENVKEKEEE